MEIITGRDARYTHGSTHYHDIWDYLLRSHDVEALNRIVEKRVAPLLQAAQPGARNTIARLCADGSPLMNRFLLIAAFAFHLGFRESLRPHIRPDRFGFLSAMLRVETLTYVYMQPGYDHVHDMNLMTFDFEKQAPVYSDLLHFVVDMQMASLRWKDDHGHFQEQYIADVHAQAAAEAAREREREARIERVPIRIQQRDARHVRVDQGHAPGSRQTRENVVSSVGGSARPSRSVDVGAPLQMTRSDSMMTEGNNEPAPFDDDDESVLPPEPQFADEEEEEGEGQRKEEVARDTGNTHGEEANA